MRKIFTHRVNSEIINNISNYVVDYLEKNISKDTCGVFMNAFVKNKQLDKIILYFVNFSNSNNNLVKITNIDNVNIYLENVNLFDMFEHKGDLCVKFKIGKILYDGSGDLKKLHKNIKLDNSIDTSKYKKAVNLKPGIQYKK